MQLMAAVKICYLPGLVLRIPAEFSCSGKVISSRLKEVPCQSGYLATGIFSAWVGSSIKISSNHTHNTIKNSNVSPRVVLKDFLRGLFWNVMVTFKVSWIKLYVHWMQWKSSLGLTWIIKNLKGDIREWERGKIGGWEITVQDLLPGWKKPVNSSLAFGQAALTFRTFCFPRAISWSSLLTFFAKEWITWSPAYWASKL